LRARLHTHRRQPPQLGGNISSAPFNIRATLFDASAVGPRLSAAFGDIDLHADKRKWEGPPTTLLPLTNTARLRCDRRDTLPSIHVRCSVCLRGSCCPGGSTSSRTITCANRRHRLLKLLLGCPVAVALLFRVLVVFLISSHFLSLKTENTCLCGRRINARTIRRASSWQRSTGKVHFDFSTAHDSHSQ
jgi:hypothetical protein